MLVAHCGGQRIEADVAEKGPEYTCPNCNELLVLKKGRIRTHHFAHKPPVGCSWGRGETREHLEAKLLFRDEFRRRGYRTEVEFEVSSLPDDRRADVIVWHPNTNQPYALELQHTPLDYDGLGHRTRSYMHAGVRVIWVPFFRPKFWAAAEPLGASGNGDYIVQRFPARPLERWVHGFSYGELWMYDPSRKAMWKAHLDKHLIHREYSEWYSSDGELQSAGGDGYISRRWRSLTLWGPYSLDQIRIAPLSRKGTSMGNHHYPGGEVGKLVLQGE